MKRSLSSLPPQFVAAYFRNQGEPVKANLLKVLGIFFPEPKLNLSKVKETNKPLIP